MIESLRPTPHTQQIIPPSGLHAVPSICCPPGTPCGHPTPPEPHTERPLFQRQSLTFGGEHSVMLSQHHGQCNVQILSQLIKGDNACYGTSCWNPESEMWSAGPTVSLYICHVFLSLFDTFDQIVICGVQSEEAFPTFHELFTERVRLCLLTA